MAISSVRVSLFISCPAQLSGALKAVSSSPLASSDWKLRRCRDLLAGRLERRRDRRDGGETAATPGRVRDRVLDRLHVVVDVRRELVDRVLGLLPRVGVGLAEVLEARGERVRGRPRRRRSRSRASPSSVPPLIVSVIDVSDVVHVVIAEQSPSAHSLVGVVSLELSLEPQPAARAERGPRPRSGRASTSVQRRRSVGAARQPRDGAARAAIRC